MLERYAFDYAVVRVVPRVERGEFLNAGVILFCPARAFLGCRIDLDRQRLQLLAPDIYLAANPQVCQGEGSIGAMTPSARFHWLVSPRSTVIQTSAVHAGVAEDPQAALESLFEKLVRR